MGTTGRTGDLVRTAAWRAGALLAGMGIAVGAASAGWAVQDVALTTVARPIALTIEGSVAGVRAGAPAAPLRLTLRNPGGEPADVTRVTATSSGSANAAAGCHGRFLRIADWTGRTTVPAGGSASVTLRVAVDERLPAACGMVAWRLVYTAY